MGSSCCKDDEQSRNCWLIASRSLVIIAFVFSFPATLATAIVVDMDKWSAFLLIFPNITGLCSFLSPRSSFIMKGCPMKGAVGIALSLNTLVVGMIVASDCFEPTLGYFLCSLAVVGAILWAVAGSLVCVLDSERRREHNNEVASDVELAEEQ